MNSFEVAAKAGITWRILDLWIHKGYVGRAHHITGSGHRRVYTEEEISHVVLTAELARAGLTPAAAGLAAEQLLADGSARLGNYRLEPITFGLGT